MAPPGPGTHDVGEKARGATGQESEKGIFLGINRKSSKILDHEWFDPEWIGGPL